MFFLTRKIKKKRTVYVLLWLNCVCFNIIIYLALNLNFNLTGMDANLQFFIRVISFDLYIT